MAKKKAVKKVEVEAVEAVEIAPEVEVADVSEVEVAEMVAAEEIATAPVSWTPMLGRTYEFVKAGEPSFLGKVKWLYPFTVERLFVRNGCRVTEEVDVTGCEIFEVTAQEVNERLG